MSLLENKKDEPKTSHEQMDVSGIKLEKNPQ